MFDSDEKILKTTRTFVKFKTDKCSSSCEKTEKARSIVCRFCGHEITTEDHIISINGSHRHVFTNPAGITFEIGCFSRADGCMVHGLPTEEHTWFRGYRWNYAHCLGCLMHLGWFYQGQSDGFFGLIVDRILELSNPH